MLYSPFQILNIIMTFSFDTNQQLSKVCEQKDMASRIAQSFIMQD